MTEAALRLSELQAIPASERENLSNEQLKKLLGDDKIINPDSSQEDVKSPLLMVQWMHKEIFNIISSVEGEADKPFSEYDTEAQIAFLLDRYKSISAIGIVIAEYKKLFRHLKEAYTKSPTLEDEEVRSTVLTTLSTYVDGFIGNFNNYLTKESNKEYRQQSKILPTTIPFEIEDLPLSLLSLNQLQLNVFDIYNHDLLSLINQQISFATRLLDPTTEYYSPTEREETLALVQSGIAKLVEFHKQFNLENLSYDFYPASIQDFRTELSRDFRNGKMRRDQRIGDLNKDNPVDYKYFDKTREVIPKLFNKATEKPETEVEYGEYTSNFSAAFLITVITNVRQNTERVNDELRKQDVRDAEGNLVQITDVTAHVLYELFDEKERPLVENQVMEEGKGVWVTLKIEDNGPGFPKKAGDALSIHKDGGFRTYTPKEGISGHGGLGIGLYHMMNNVRNAGGIFETYSVFDNEAKNKGAVTYISFPLLRIP